MWPSLKNRGRSVSIPWLSAAVVLLSLAVLNGCEAANEVPTALPTDPSDIRQFVTGDAAQALNAAGQFALPSSGRPGGDSAITATRAGELALAYVRTFGPSFDEEWEAERGEAIDLSQLRTDPRILFAQTPYGPFPDEGFHPAFRRLYGPFFLVTLRSGDMPVLLFAVSAYNVDVDIDRFGRLILPLLNGNGFFSSGIPKNRNVFELLSPEEAVERVGRLTGARTESVPELVLTGRNYSPLLAVWKLTLDRPVTGMADSTGRRVETRTLYVGSTPKRDLLVPTPNQPDIEHSYGVKVTPNGQRLGLFPFQIELKTGEATIFERVRVKGGK